MNKHINSVLVLGLGKVGYLVALLLHETGFKVTGADQNLTTPFPFRVQTIDVIRTTDITDLFQYNDAVISCLPYHCNIGVAQIAAQIAAQFGMHYFDLTEDVHTTGQTIEMGKTSSGIMASQCGLALGFIAIAGTSLTSKFDKNRSIKLRVGA